MSKTKKILAVILAVISVFALSLTAFAAAGDPLTISVKSTAENPDNHTYSVYQICTGDYYNGKLSNIAWGKNGTGTEGDEMAQSDVTGLKGLAESTAADAQKLVSLGAYVNLNSAPIGTVKAGTPLTVVEGYYLVKDNDTLPADDSYSLYIVKVGSENIEIERKAAIGATPTIEKQADGADATTAAIGDIITYTVKATPKNLTEYYTVYKLEVNDTLDAGLKFYKDASAEKYVKVMVGSTDVTDKFTETVNNTTLKISCDNILAIAGVSASSEFVFTYKAELTENATSGKDGNGNTAKLTYSNNPNLNENGTPRTPDELDTPATSTVYTSTLIITSDPTGGEFELYKKGEDTPIAPTSTNRWDGLDDGEYVLKEKNTPDGYNTNKDIPFTIATTIDDNGDRTALTANGLPAPTIDLNAGTISATVSHTEGVQLPVTGTIGIVLLAGAAAVVTGTAFGIRAKGRKEDEEENA